MLTRRELMAGSAALLTGDDAVAAAQGGSQETARQLSSVAGAINALREELQISTATVNLLRERQRGFLRLQQRFPECIDVGIRIWERMVDWHVAHQRPLTIQRSGDGRLQMDFIGSVLVLRLELRDDEVGQAYDR